MMLKRNLSGIGKLPLIAIGAVVVIAGVTLLVVNKDNNSVKREGEAETISNLEPLSGELLTPERVKELASSESPNVEVNAIELEREDNAVLYKVKLANGSVIFFDAKSGDKVTREAGKDDEVTNGTLPAGFTTSIDFNAARDMAKTLKPDGTIRKIHLQMENGVTVYSIRFTDNARIDINAIDGSVVRNDPAPAPKNDGAGNSGSSSGRAGDDGTNGGSKDDSSGRDGSGHGSDD